MSEVLGVTALFIGGIALFKGLKKIITEASTFAPQPVRATVQERRPSPRTYTRLVQDPVTGKYRPAE